MVTAENGTALQRGAYGFIYRPLEDGERWRPRLADIWGSAAATAAVLHYVIT